MNIRNQIKKVFGSDVLDRGRNVYVNCPFCLSRKGSPDQEYHLGIRIDPEKPVVGCFRCGFRGSIKYMFKQLGIVLVDEPKEAVDFPAIVKEFIHGLSVETLDPPDLVEKYGLVSCLERSNNISRRCISYLRRRGLSDEMIEWVDPHYSNDYKYLGRVVIPFYDEDGLMEYFVARDLGRGIKTSNPKEGKQGVMYNFHHAKKFDRVIVVEGMFDAMSTGRNATALLGSFITREQIRVLADAKIPEIIVLLDADAVDKAIKVYHALVSGTSSRVGLCPLREGDPDENRDHIKEILKHDTLWGDDVLRLEAQMT